MTTQLTRYYWINTLKVWAEDRLMPPQFDECCAVLDEPAAELAALRAQRDDLLEVLRWLDIQGGLGFDKHARIRSAIARATGQGE